MTRYGLTPLHPESPNRKTLYEWQIRKSSSKNSRPLGQGVTGLTTVELLIICCIIFILIGTFGVYINKILVEAKETALKMELLNLKTNLRLYKILRNANPLEIKDFYKYEKDRADREGCLLDPFKNRYIYDAKLGEIRSCRKGYEMW